MGVHDGLLHLFSNGGMDLPHHDSRRLGPVPGPKGQAGATGPTGPTGPKGDNSFNSDSSYKIM